MKKVSIVLGGSVVALALAVTGCGSSSPAPVAAPIVVQAPPAPTPAPTNTVQVPVPVPGPTVQVPVPVPGPTQYVPAPQPYNPPAPYVPSSSVWMSAPTNHSTVVFSQPNVGIQEHLDAGQYVSIVCSVSGPYIDSPYGGSSNWDYVTAPYVGYVADARVNTSGSTAPRC